MYELQPRPYRNSSNFQYEESKELPVYDGHNESSLNYQNILQNAQSPANLNEAQDLKCQGEGSTGSCGMVKIKKRPKK